MDKELIYFDAQTKSLVSTTNEPEQLTFKDIRNTDIIMKPEDYKMSIVRFQCDTSLLPVFIPQIQPNQANPNLTTYAVRLDYAGQFVETDIIWSPEIQGIATPNAPSIQPYGLQQESLYYYTLNYQHFIDLINDALLICMNALKVLDPTLIAISTPFLGWNSTTLCAEAVVDPAFESSQIRLFFNKSLYALFSSFASLTFPNNTALGNLSQLRIESNNLYNVEVNYRGTGSNKIVLKQNYSTISSWSPVSSIVFTSNSIPVVSSYVSTPQVNFEGQAYPVTSGTNNTVNIITDISTLENSYKPTLIYNPTAEYRFFSLYGSSPLKNIEVQCFWRNTSGNYIPLLISSGGSASLKILFQKR